jgi:hypothetical protein
MKLSILFSFLLFFFSQNYEKQENVPISCVPVKQISRATISSVSSGNWSDPNTWGGTIPSSTDLPKISTGTVVYADTSVTVAGMEVEGMLSFVPTISVTIQSTKNIVVTGTLEAIIPNPLITQTIKFIGINETNFVGGGMDVLATDIGIWVMGAGKLNLEGAYRTPYVHADTSIASGTNSILLKETPVGWKVGDELTIAPTTNSTRVFDETTIQSLNQKQLGTSSNIGHAHPKINQKWTAEIINLTRNVRIEGTATGRTHVFIRSTQPQRILNTQLRYVGPRKQQSGSSATEFLLGRYGLHFHHCMNGSVGSLVDGSVIRDAGSHAYVPHVSHGISMNHNVAYKCTEAPFWWDLPDATNNTKWIGNIVAAPTFIEGSIDIDTDGAPSFGVHGFVLSMGDDNVCDSNVVVGQIGNETVNAAFDWEEMDVESAWQFRGNLAHNCDNGLRSWQNNQKNHVLEGTTIYNSNLGVFHGAYGNNYTYRGGEIYASVFEIHAAGQENSVRLENMIFDGGKAINYPVHLVDGPIAGVRPIFFRNCTLRNGIQGHLWNESDDQLKNVDMIHCTVSADSIKVNPSTSETVRVQPLSGQSYRVKKSGITNISAFAPTIWGTGNGLNGEYFNNTDFTSPAFTRTEPIVLFEEWQTPVPGNATGVHYSISDLSYSTRYTGWVEPQYTENYVFKTATGGGVKLWVNDVLIINQWSEPYPTTRTSSSIALTAGQKYKIKLEYFNTDDRSNLSLYWQSTSLAQQIIPQTQLYTDTTGTPPSNQAPTAIAGSDVSITLPTSSVSLNGSSSFDTDGTINTYAWSKISGPSTFTISTPGSANTNVTGLVAGTYVFRLSVTDDDGATATDDVTVTVNNANVAPTANAGSDVLISLPTNSVSLSGSASADSDGTISTYAWAKVSGPSTFTISTPGSVNTNVTGLVAGTYVFRLTVTDNQGATATDDVTVTVNQGPVAHAGSDLNIQLPVNSVNLSGSTSTDSDGTIVSYHWSKVSGPTTYNITNEDAVSTSVTNLVAGTYTFRLTITDNNGATSFDDVVVVVQPANIPPVANAGNDETINLQFTLSGTGTDSDGSVVSYLWEKISGPTCNIVNPNQNQTTVNQLTIGVYVFRLTVTDNQGATSTSTVTKTIQ